MKNIFLYALALFTIAHFTLAGKSMNILCITHVDFETPGIIEDWATSRGHRFTISKPYAGDNCLAHKNIDMLILMGGPQSAGDYTTLPYLTDEITLIKQAIKEHKIVVGFCLGAQLIGEALGAKAEKSPEKEIGIFPIALNAHSAQDPVLKNFPPNFPVMHWHNDMPGLTKDAIILASSAGCPQQIVRYAKQVYGFQCHLEITKPGMALMLEKCPNDLKPSRFTQTAPEILAGDYTDIHTRMFAILDRLAAG